MRVEVRSAEILNHEQMRKMDSVEELRTYVASSAQCIFLILFMVHHDGSINIEEVSMKDCNGHAGMLSVTEFACEASFLNLSIWKQERELAMLL